jgi:hypothetical protein
MRTGRPRSNGVQPFAEVFLVKYAVFMRHLSDRSIFILTEIGGRV